MSQFERLNEVKELKISSFAQRANVLANQKGAGVRRPGAGHVSVA